MVVELDAVALASVAGTGGITGRASCASKLLTKPKLGARTFITLRDDRAEAVVEDGAVDVVRSVPVLLPLLPDVDAVNMLWLLTGVLLEF